MLFRLKRNRILMSRGQYGNTDIVALCLNSRQRKRVQKYLTGLFNDNKSKQSKQKMIMN